MNKFNNWNIIILMIVLIIIAAFSTNSVDASEDNCNPPQSGGQIWWSQEIAGSATINHLPGSGGGSITGLRPGVLYTVVIEAHSDAEFGCGTDQSDETARVSVNGHIVTVTDGGPSASFAVVVQMDGSLNISATALGRPGSMFVKVEVTGEVILPTPTPPTETPTEEPTEVPTEEPTETPTEVPTEEPTVEPTPVHVPSYYEYCQIHNELGLTEDGIYGIGGGGWIDVKVENGENIVQFNMLDPNLHVPGSIWTVFDQAGNIYGEIMIDDLSNPAELRCHLVKEEDPKHVATDVVLRDATCFNNVIVAEDRTGEFHDISRVSLDGSYVNLTASIGVGHDSDPNIVDCSKYAFIRDGILWIQSLDGTMEKPVTFEGETFSVTDVVSNGNGLIGFIDMDGDIHVVDAYLETGRASFEWTNDGTNAVVLAMAPDGTVAYVDQNSNLFASSANGLQQYQLNVATSGGLNFNEDGSILIANLGNLTFEVIMNSGEVNILDGDEAHYIEVDPEGSTLALVTSNEVVSLGNFTGDFFNVFSQLLVEFNQTDWWSSECVEAHNTLALVSGWATHIR